MYLGAMEVTIKLEFTDDRAADVIRWLQNAPIEVEVYLIPSRQSETPLPNGHLNTQPAVGEVR
jgi:hypothetical protein